jgi:glycogen phosphorylase
MRSGVANQPRTHKADCSPIRAGLDADAIATALIDNLYCLQGKLPRHATRNDWYLALAYTVRDRMMHRYIATVESIADTNRDAKVVAYLSAEFLTGPHLGNGLINLGIWQAVEEALSRVGQDLSNLLEQEEEPGLGNGGLGRLAACYMDSLATLDIPAVGYGIRYEFGIFDQAIRRLADRAYRQVAALREPVGDRAFGNHFRC